MSYVLSYCGLVGRLLDHKCVGGMGLGSVKEDKTSVATVRRWVNVTLGKYRYLEDFVVGKFMDKRQRGIHWCRFTTNILFSGDVETEFEV